MTLDEMLAQAEIRETLVGYNMAGDEQRKDELAGFFTEDGVLNVPGRSAHGRAEIAAMLQGFAANRTGPSGKPVIRHNLTTSQIVVNGDEASGRTYWLVVGDKGPDHQGVYIDRFRKVDGRWLIAERAVCVDWEAKQWAAQA